MDRILDCIFGSFIVIILVIVLASHAWELIRSSFLEDDDSDPFG